MVVTSFADTSITVPSVEGLDEPYATHFAQCHQVWSENRSKNLTRRAYYEGKNRLKNIGIAIPKELETLEIVVDWARIAVDELANLSRFDGFTGEGSDGLKAIMTDNRFNRKYRMLTRSELVQGLSFATVTKGEEDEPNVRIRTYSAVNAACLWDYRLDRIKCGITVHDVNENGIPTRYMLYEPDCNIEIVQADTTRWTCVVSKHPMGRPQMEPIIYNADDDYPLGHSRITKGVMNITDRAVREALRTELASEFAATPQKYLLGGTAKDKAEAMQQGTRWEMYAGAIQWFTKDRDGDIPQYGQLPQVSMTPHSEYFMHLAEEFAAVTRLPVDMLVRSRTYTSSDSAQANKDSLVKVAETMNDDNGDALAVIGRMALAIESNSSFNDTPSTIMPVFKDPQRSSKSAEADWMVKMCSVFPWLAETSVALERAGFTESERIRIDSEKRRVQAAQRMQAMEEAAAKMSNGGQR